MQNNSTWASSALSPTLWPDKAWNPWLSAGATLATLAITIIVAMIYVATVWCPAVGPACLQKANAIPPFTQLLLQIATYVPLVPFILVVLPPLSRVSLARLGIRKPTAREIGAGLIGTVAMWLAVVLSGSALAALTHRHDTEAAVVILKGLKTPLQLTVFFLVACVFAPIVEELTFRVLVFNALTKYMSVIVAAIVSGLLFGGEHAIGEPLGQLATVALPLAFGGFVLAIVYSTTRCFWSNVTTHACFNAINVVALVVFHVT